MEWGPDNVDWRTNVFLSFREFIFGNFSSFNALDHKDSFHLSDGVFSLSAAVERALRQDITLIVILSVLVPLVLLLFICAFRKYNKKNRSDGTLYEVADFGKRLFGVFLEFWAEFMASALRGGSFRRRFISARYYLNNFKKEDFFLSVSTRFVFMFLFVNFIICTFCFLYCFQGLF